MKHFPSIEPVRAEVADVLPAELYTADDPFVWVEAMTAKYGPNFEDMDGEGGL